MTTTIITDNLINSTADFIVHQVNCQFVMGSGVAKALKEKYPIIYNEYLYKKDNRPSHYHLGEIQVIHINEKQNVVNLFGQNFYGRDGKQYTSYDAINNGLKELKLYVLCHKLCTMQDTIKIAFPYGMGAGLGGGNWNIIKTIIESVFEDTNFEIQYFT